MSAIPRASVFLDVFTTRIPLSVHLAGAQPTALGGEDKRILSEVCSRKCGERNKFVGTCKRGKNEPIDVVFDGAGEQFAERARITAIGTVETSKILRSVFLIDHRRWIAVPNEKQVQRQAPDTSVAVAEWMDPLEHRMQVGEAFDCMPLPEAMTIGVDAFDPIHDERRHLRPLRRLHAGVKGLDVVAAERPGALALIELVRRELQPCRLDH